MFPKLPTVTKGLLLSNVVIFLFQMMLGENTFATLMLWPLGGDSFETLISGASFMPWQLLTYGFLHEGFQHLFFISSQSSCSVRHWSIPGVRSAF